jgi:serine/threonine protein kinase
MPARSSDMDSASDFVGTPTLASLRRLLNRILSTDSDFEAFCLDHFSEVKAQFSDGMTRVRKVSMLLESVDSVVVLTRLAESFPSSIAEHAGELLCVNDQTPEYRSDQTRELGERLRRLYECREERSVLGDDTAQINQEILATRRELRQGPQLQAGEYLHDGRYRLVRRIGKGGFATVWQAYDRQAKEPVAVKVLHGQWADDLQRLERFYRGARRMAQLHHSGIARVIDEPQEERGFHYFVIEYVPGGDLRQKVLDHQISPAEGLKIIRIVGQALSHAHQRGVIHRDVKPANVLLGEHGPALTDFDLAWAIDTTGGTQTGALGTFLYAAPEMMQDATDVTPCADVYSLAMSAVFVLYGAEPVEMVGDRLGFLRALVPGSGLLAVLSKATEREPQNRFQTVNELCSALADHKEFAPHIISDLHNNENPLTISQITPGVIINDFRIIKKLGIGGMGSVYLGEHQKIGKLAAIKFLSESFTHNEETKRRFLNEARAVNHIRHSGLVDIFDFGHLHDGTLFLIMEYLHGDTLGDRIKRFGRLPLEKTLPIAQNIAEILAAVHARGIIHRDVKPANVMLIPDPHTRGGERVKILDFGVAVLADSLDIEEEMLVIGTPLYMSPEQYNGSHGLTDKVDVYSLGIVLFEMLTGQGPFHSKLTFEIMIQHLSQAPPLLSELMPKIPKKLSDLVNRMLAKHPDTRPTMEEVAAELAALQ